MSQGQTSIVYKTFSILSALTFLKTRRIVSTLGGPNSNFNSPLMDSSASSAHSAMCSISLMPLSSPNKTSRKISASSNFLHLFTLKSSISSRLSLKSIIPPKGILPFCAFLNIRSKFKFFQDT